jgi:hypothetical protein
MISFTQTKPSLSLIATWKPGSVDRIQLREFTSHSKDDSVGSLETQEIVLPIENYVCCDGFTMILGDEWSFLTVVLFSKISGLDDLQWQRFLHDR